MKLKALFFSIFLSGIASANASEMGIVTGGKQGTYIKIGRDIANLLAEHKIQLNVYPSSGSLENIADVLDRKGVQLGIVQSDVLGYVRSNSNENAKLKRIINKIRMVFPLYNEEVHILASKNISSIDDLEGKRVATGKSTSGTSITASFIFEITGINPAEKLNIGGETALKELKAGKIDAMFYVSGYPVSLFNTQVDNVHLLNIGGKDVLEYYVESKIPADTYPFQKEAVSTVAVKAVLMSYDYKGNSCDNVGNAAKIVYDNIGNLKKNGHPKWANIDLDYRLSKWEQYSCVSKKLGQAVAVDEKENDSCNKSSIAKALCEMAK